MDDINANPKYWMETQSRSESVIRASKGRLFNRPKDIKISAEFELFNTF